MSSGRDSGYDERTVSVLHDSEPRQPRHRVAPIGRYVVLGHAGSGGMGEVYRAYDPKLQREVALKLVHDERLNRDSRLRIVREARAMAKINHANVVAVYDVEEEADGIAAGLVLVMEYVAGQTLREWLRSGDREVGEIVKIFVHAGDGLVAAHRQDVLHRDFKPANVLVSTTGEVKVTDFGLAKPASSDAASDFEAPVERTSDLPVDDEDLTRDGTVMGTPLYMAPEQHEGEPLGPASDQYAFCISLWQALCGRPPFEGSGLGVIKRGPLPVWPDATTPRYLVSAIERGLAVLPKDRWPTMEDLVSALRAPPARPKRRWIPIAGAVLVLGGLGWISLRQPVPAQPCSDARDRLAGVWDSARRDAMQAAILGTGVVYADALWRRAGADLEAFATRWTQAYTDACEATAIRGEQSSAALDLRMACLSHAKTELAALVDVLSRADAGMLVQAHETIAALPALERCADLDALQRNSFEPTSEQAQPVATIRRELATARASRGVALYTQADEHLQRAEFLDDATDFPPVHLEVMMERARTDASLGAYEAAEASLRAALSQAVASQQWSVAGEAATELIFVVAEYLARPAEGLRYRELATGLAVGDAVAMAEVHTSLGRAHQEDGKYAQAEAEFRQALALSLRAPSASPLAVARARSSVANTLHLQGKFEEAVAENRALQGFFVEALGPDHPQVATSRNNIGLSLLALGKVQDAEVEIRAALAIRVAALGPAHTTTADTHSNLGKVLMARAEPEQAKTEFETAVRLQVDALGADHPAIAALRGNLATAFLILQDYGRAESELRLLVALQEKTLGPEHPNLALTLNNLASAVYEKHDYTEAASLYQRALRIREAALGSEHPKVAMARTNLAMALQDDGRPGEALPFVEVAWARRQARDIPPKDRANTEFLYAQILSQVDPAQRDKARALAQSALENYRADTSPHDAELAEITTWLAGRP